MALAQTQSVIAVTCRGTGAVSAQTLSALCSALPDALATKYPNASFVLTDAAPANAGFLTLDAFMASRSGIEARLNWQAAGQDQINGPRMSFSIIDKDMTPAMSLQFLNRLVHDTSLPF